MIRFLCHLLCAKNVVLATMFALHGNATLAALGYALALAWYAAPTLQPATR